MKLHVEMPNSLPVEPIEDPTKALRSLVEARQLNEEFILEPGQPLYTLRDLVSGSLRSSLAEKQFAATADKRFGDFLPFDYKPSGHQTEYVEGTCMCGRPIRFTRRNVRRLLENPRPVYYSPVEIYTPAPEGAEVRSFYVCPHIEEGLARHFQASNYAWDQMRRRLAQRGSTYPVESAKLELEYTWFRRDTGLCSFLLDMGEPDPGHILFHIGQGDLNYTKQAYRWGPKSTAPRVRGQATDKHPHLKARFYALRARARQTGRPFGWDHYFQFLEDIKVPEGFDKDPRGWRLTWEGAARKGYTKHNFSWAKTTPITKPPKPWEGVQDLQAAQDALPVHALGLEIEDSFELGILVGMQLLEPGTYAKDFTELLQDSAAEIRALKSQ